MAFTATRNRDTKPSKVFMHRTADYRGGVAISTDNFGGGIIPEGTPITAPINGICKPFKVVKPIEDSNGTTVTVANGHGLTIGETIDTDKKVTKIEYGMETDKITFDKAITAKAGKILTTSTKPEGVPFALTGENVEIYPRSNAFSSAIIIGVTINHDLGEELTPKGIVNVNTKGGK